jgi:hypothetical protein
MSDNKDIPILAKKIYELSTLTPAALDARKWEALLILNAVYSSATPEGIAKANADKEARWGAAIQQEGILSRMHPKWHLRTDDGKPPAAKQALESAIKNPNRDLRARLATLQFIAPADRSSLEDLARALISDAFNSAKSEAREQYLDIMSARSKTWFREPWKIVLPYEGNPPAVMLLIDNQGSTNNGGIFDDPANDTLWDKLSWSNAVRTWDVDFLRDNVLAQSYLKLNDLTNKAVDTAVDTAGDIAEGAKEAAKGIATILKWAPYVIAGIGAIGATAIVLAAVKRTPQLAPIGG